jgi:glutamine synthetase type III
MSATNAHRLGGHEAPPVIISSFLGAQLTQVLDAFEESESDEILLLKGKKGMKLDIPQIPELFIDNTDRNRTSPFAFTGNRFEFRAVGSEANCASAMIALNSAMAYQLIEFKRDVDALIGEGEQKMAAIVNVIRRYIKECKAIRFDGNGYTISNVYIDIDGYKNAFGDDADAIFINNKKAGLFESVGADSVVYNFKMSNYIVKGGYNIFGAIAAENSGTIERIEVKDLTASVSTNFYGGIVGTNTTAQAVQVTKTKDDGTTYKEWERHKYEETCNLFKKEVK